MGYGTNGLSFNTLRRANIQRLPQFKNAQGEPAHAKPDGSDWSPADWITAALGELGEAANLMKKIKRGDFGQAGDASYKIALEALRLEFADVVTYMDLLAYQFRFNLGEAIEYKFNNVSHRVGAAVFIHGDDWHVKPF